jgi:hypothetical protein
MSCHRPEKPCLTPNLPRLGKATLLEYSVIRGSANYHERAARWPKRGREIGM